MVLHGGKNGVHIPKGILLWFINITGGINDFSSQVSLLLYTLYYYIPEPCMVAVRLIDMISLHLP